MKLESAGLLFYENRRGISTVRVTINGENKYYTGIQAEVIRNACNNFRLPQDEEAESERQVSR